VLRLLPHRPPRLDADEERDVRTLTRVAFSRRRKQLQKILRTAPEYALDPVAAESLLGAADIAPDARPETLAPATFVVLSRALRSRGLPLLSHGSPTDLQAAPSDDGVRAFIGLVGHELRSPVAAILGYSELMVDGLYGTVDERAREGVRRIAGAARQLRALIEGMELVVGQGNPGLELTGDVDLRSVVRDAADEAGIEAALRGALIELDIEEDTPRARTDPDALARALGLVFGAILKAAPRGAIHVRAHRLDDRVAITLEGPFELTADPLGTPETIHSGIALRMAMAARAIDALGGRFDRAARPGRTRLRIVLPSD
jgi:signal transduction histidine kinase